MKALSMPDDKEQLVLDLLIALVELVEMVQEARPLRVLDMIRAQDELVVRSFVVNCSQA